MRNPFVRSRRLLSCPFVWKQQDKVMNVTLHVCTTCKAGETVPDGTACPGTKLHAALVAAGAPAGGRDQTGGRLFPPSPGSSPPPPPPGPPASRYRTRTHNHAPPTL